MLTTKCINPEVMAALAMCGHGSKVLLTDGNYPVAQKTGDSKKIYLSIMPGLPTVTQVLEAIHSVVEIEKAEVMSPEDGSEPEVFAEFRRELGLELDKCGRYEFYDKASEPDVYVSIHTGEKRVFSNILLTIGCA